VSESLSAQVNGKIGAPDEACADQTRLSSRARRGNRRNRIHDHSSVWSSSDRASDPDGEFLRGVGVLFEPFAASIFWAPDLLADRIVLGLAARSSPSPPAHGKSLSAQR
jgi:hypothetical protein